MGNIVKMYIKSLKDPFSTIKEVYDNKSKKSAMLIILVNAVLSGVLVFALIKGLFSNVEKTLNTYSLGMYSTYSSTSKTMSSDAMVGMVSAGIVIALFIFFSYLIFALISKILTKIIAKGNAKTSDYMRIEAGAVVSQSTLKILVIIISFFSLKIAGILLVFSMLFNMVSYLQGMTELLEPKKDKVMYAVVLSYIGTLIIWVLLAQSLFSNIS